MEIKLNEHIVKIEGKEYIPYDIALKAIEQIDTKKIDELLDKLQNLKIDLND